MSQRSIIRYIRWRCRYQIVSFNGHPSKPAVPIAGKYRLVDIPISNCLNSSINSMFVLTMYNSASLNRHIKNTYHFSAFSTCLC